jgi:hypothetical protein
MFDEMAVRIHLHHKIFASVHAVSHMSCRDGTSRQRGIHFVYCYLRTIYTYHLCGILLTKNINIEAPDVTVHDLVHRT